jgi:hypothetical protein
MAELHRDQYHLYRELIQLVRAMFKIRHQIILHSPRPTLSVALTGSNTRVWQSIRTARNIFGPEQASLGLLTIWANIILQTLVRTTYWCPNLVSIRNKSLGSNCWSNPAVVAAHQDHRGWLLSLWVFFATQFNRVKQVWVQSPWTWDVMALLFAGALFAADITILAVYDGSTLSRWQAGISINTIVSTISTVAMFTLMNPLGGAVGQCK